MTYIKTFFISLFLIAPLLFAQNEKTESEKEKVNSLEKGSWSLQFQITENFQLKSFNGQTISAKYNLSRSNAIRAGISLNSGFSDSDENQENNQNDYYDTRQSERDIFDITVNTDYLINLSPQNQVNFFVGGGLFLGYSSRITEYSKNDYYVDTLLAITNFRGDYKTNKYGINLLAGVEWFVSSFISIHAEYNSQLYFSNGTSANKTEVNYPNQSSKNYTYLENDENKSFIINASNVKFGLSVYF